MIDLFAHLNRPIPDYLQELFQITKKRDLKKFAREVAITQRDFVTLVWNAYSIGYKHFIHPHETWPPDARFDVELLSKPDDHPERSNKSRFVGQINRIFKQRRIFAAHLFINLERWPSFTSTRGTCRHPPIIGGMVPIFTS